ncbi:MAG: IgA Peptidase M64 [Bacteroidales bacterium]|nr:IgA Peptidase M64 [Bacteroidales bacterium]
MKNIIILLFVLISNSLFSQIDFDKYFEDKTLRFDYNIGGNHENSSIFLNKIKEEPYWGGSKINLIDKFNFGDFRIMIYDSVSKILIYSRGYSNLYCEWSDTKEANYTSRSFYESVTLPYPKKTILLKIEMRDKKTNFNTLFKTYVNPKDISIIKDKQNTFTSQKLYNSGNHHKKLDIVIIPDGYTEPEMSKFHNDCERFMNCFFGVEPFKTHKDKVNFWAVDAFSEESGTDIPGKHIWKNTVINTHFYTFGHERYLTTQDIETLRDIAAYVPYDQIYILVNTSKYGGGGIYNYYSLCSADHPQSGRVFTHEFGHAFAALADEYGYDNGKAEDIYDMTVEPWQVNITNLVDFASKWKNLVENDTPIPTDATPENYNKIGAFEGAGYVKEKIFRPTYDCKMRSNDTDEFCPVCYKAVLDMLLFYAE